MFLHISNLDVLNPKIFKKTSMDEYSLKKDSTLSKPVLLTLETVVFPVYKWACTVFGSKQNCSLFDQIFHRWKICAGHDRT